MYAMRSRFPPAAWEYEAYCNRREKGLPMDDLFNNRGGPDGQEGY